MTEKNQMSDYLQSNNLGVGFQELCDYVINSVTNELRIRLLVNKVVICMCLSPFRIELNFNKIVKVFLICFEDPFKSYFLMFKQKTG